MKMLLCAAAVAGLIGITPFSHAQDVVKTVAAKSDKKQPGAKSDSNSKIKGLDVNAGTTGPITTEIYADEAFFDSSKSIGIFRGHVKVSDPRFNLQSDKLTTFISKSQTGQAAQSSPTAQNSPTAQTSPAENGQTGQGQGLEKAIAEGNVAVVRDRPDPNGGPPSHAVGRAESATYVAATGDVELKGNPRVQQGLNTHIATSPETVMVINQSGQLTTHGPSRTEIRQQPKDEKDGEKEEHKPKPQSSPAT